ncbi:MAG: lysophospholipid acyltransferase family protein [Nitriliruptorales bacterium]|nr:lysophospholipid acyltransferase family protein [Nitriliruptorales bacterium]
MSRPKLPLFWRFIAFLAVAFARVLLRWRIDVRGLEHVPREGGAVIAFNHHSYFDFVMTAWAIVLELRRPVRFLAKREIWQSPWVGWIVRFAGAVPVDRTSSDSRHRAFDAAIDALRDGELVAVAPEQTISKSFRLLPFRTGAARMAQAADVPIVPAVGWGTQRFATKGRRPRIVRKIPVMIEYGEPIRVPPDTEPVAATRELQDQMQAMLDRSQRDYPDRPRPGEEWWQPAHLGGTAPTHEEVLAEHLARERRWDRDGGQSDVSEAEGRRSPPEGER